MRFVPMLALLPLLACAAPDGIPEGESTWSGFVTIFHVETSISVALTNNAGDLTAVIDTLDDAGESTGQLDFSGTYDPRSHGFAVIPASGPLGFYGVWSPEAQTIDGVVGVVTAQSEQTVPPGPGILTLESGDGEPTSIGKGRNGLEVGTHSFSGALLCQVNEFPAEGTLTYADDGAVAVEITFAIEDLATPIGTLSLTGVHNPDSGSITLIPGPWLSWDATDTNYESFFLGGAYKIDDRKIVATLGPIPGDCEDDLTVFTLD